MKLRERLRQLRSLSSKLQDVIEQQANDAIETAARLRDDYTKQRYLNKVNYQLDIQTKFLEEAFATVHAAKASKKQPPRPTAPATVQRKEISIRELAYTRGKEYARAESLARCEKFEKQPVQIGLLLKNMTVQDFKLR